VGPAFRNRCAMQHRVRIKYCWHCMLRCQDYVDPHAKKRVGAEGLIVQSRHALLEHAGVLHM
jgi:hypothetical protein